MVHGVTLNYHTGHVTGEVDLHHPRQLSSLEISYLEKTVIVTVSIAFEFLKDTTFLFLPVVQVGFHQGMTTSSNAEQSGCFSSQETHRHIHDEMRDGGVCYELQNRTLL